MKISGEIGFILLMALATVLPSACKSAEIETIPGHAHNDYYHARPLHDALAHRFRSVEVDVFLADGDLMVAHSPNEIESGKTLRSLYLEPLRQRIAANGGRVYPGCEQPLLLLIDIKTNGGQTWPLLHSQLAEYADILSVYRQGELEPGPVLAVISGSRPIEAMAASDPLYAGVDGRVGELTDAAPPAFMPLVSDHWRSHFSWDGEGEMPADQRAKLVDIVERVIAAGVRLRFWATPEKPAIWRELLKHGVDLINTDQLGRFEEFYSGRKQTDGSRPTEADTLFSDRSEG